MKRLWPVVVCMALGLLFLYEADRACQANRSLDEYRARAAAQDALIAEERAKAAAALEVIAAKDAEIAAVKAEAAKPRPAEIIKDREIAALEAKLTALEAQGDIAGALAASKAENAAWAEKFTLAEGRYEDALAALDKAWQGKFDAQVVISKAGWSAYDEEHVTRLDADKRIADLVRREKRSKFWKYAGPALGFAAGLIAGK